MTRRILTYLLGLFIMTIGIGLSLKSNLGVSPVSSIPYTITLITGIEMGKATMLFHVLLIVFQLALLRSEFKGKHMFQLMVAVVFGYFTTFSNYLMTFLPTPETYMLRLIILLISIVCVAIGIFLYLPPDMVPLAGEGAMQAVAHKTGVAFPKVKVAFDTLMVLISGTTCCFLLRGLGSVGAGTIISALLVGSVLSFIMKAYKHKLNAFLSGDGIDL